MKETGKERERREKREKRESTKKKGEKEGPTDRNSPECKDTIHIGRLTLGTCICMHINHYRHFAICSLHVVRFDSHTHLPNGTQHHYDNLPVSPNKKVLTGKLYVVGFYRHYPLS